MGGGWGWGGEGGMQKYAAVESPTKFRKIYQANVILSFLTIKRNKSLYYESIGGNSIYVKLIH